MKIIYTCCLSLLLLSCFTKDTETEQLNQRVTNLEQKVNSFSGDGNTMAKKSGQETDLKKYSSGSPLSGGQCQAMTKKGNQCSRKARSNSYCWQHGG